jgi:hypothetical protein
MFIQASQAIAEVRNPALTNERSQSLSDARHMAVTDASIQSKFSFKSVSLPLSV